MKILTVTNLYPHPKKPTHGMYNAQLFEAFAQAGHDVRNWCLMPEFNVWRWGEIRSWTSPYGGAVRTAYRPVWYLPVVGRCAAWRTYEWSLRRHSREAAEANVLYAAWLYPDGAAVAALAGRVGRPFALMVQGSDIQHLWRAGCREPILRAVGNARAVICVSRNLKEALCSFGVAPERIDVVPNGVDTERFRYRPRETSREALAADGLWPADVPRDARVLLFVGHLWPVKRVDRLIDAWSMLAPRGRADSARFLVIGDGPERRRLEKQADRLGLRSAVRFLGAVGHEAIPLWMNAADGLGLSSRSEGMPNVVLEALVSGLPIVATDVGACRELLEDEPMGRVVPQGDPGAIAGALKEILSADADRAAMAARHQGRRSWRRQAEEIVRRIERERGV